MLLGNKIFAGSIQYYRDYDASYPVSFQFAQDLNDDGIDEVVFAAFETQPNSPENYSNTLVQIFGWKSGVFQNITSDWLPNNSNQVQGVGDISFGDFNGDGRIDAFLSAYTDMEHPVNAYALMNQGTYFNVLNLGSGLWMHASATADINKDGFHDLVPTGYNGDIPTYLGSAAGLIPLQGMMGGSGIALGDFLGDGSVTAIYVDAGDDSTDTKLVRFEINETTSTVAQELVSILPAPRLTQIDEGDSHDIRARTLDFNDDGLDDVLVFSYQYSTNAADPHKSEIQFLQNLGGGRFSDVTDIYRVGYDVSGYVGYVPQLIDINLDGRTDIFTSNRDWLPVYRSTTLLVQDQSQHFIDTGKNDLLLSVGSEGMAVVVVGPNNSMHLVTESGWLSAGQETILNIQEITFPERENSETLNGTLADDHIWGMGGSDLISGRKGNDYLDGGNGIDTAFYRGNLEDYEVDLNALVVVDTIAARDGRDTLVNFERLHFSDANVALDTDLWNNAGSAYRLYKAAFDRAPDEVGLGYWIDQLDDGASLQLAASGFIHSAEFAGLYGANPSDTLFLTKLYNNVLDRDPDQGGLNYWIDKLNGGMSRESALINFSESNENVSNVADLIANGIQYQQWLV